MTRRQLCLVLLLGLHGLVIQSKGSSVSTTLSDDQTQGNNLKEIMENLITDDKCSQFLEQLALDCSTLKVSSNVGAILNFCTQEDYNKLRAAICTNTPTPPPVQSSSPSSTTTTTSKIAPASATSSSSNQVQNNPVLNSEQAQRDKIKEVTENEVSSMCSERVEDLVTGDTIRDQLCDEFELIGGTITRQGCTQQEYNKLHKVICDFVGSPALNSEQAQRDDIKRVTENEISDSCSERVAGLAPGNEPLDRICETLELLEGTITRQGCTQQEYNKLHEVMCNYVNSSDSESTVKPPTTAPPTPKPTTSSSTTTPKATADPTTSGPNTPNQGQTSTGITTAKQVTDQELDDPTIQSNGALVSGTLNNDQTQGNNLKELIKNLITDDKCTQFLEQLTPDCYTLSSNVAAILIFCTQEDYNKLRVAICNNTPTPNPAQSSSPSSTTTTTSTLAPAPATSSAPNQGQNTSAPITTATVQGVPANGVKQREVIKCFFENELSSHQCKAAMELLAKEDMDLQAGCSLLESLEPAMPVVGCTEDDYTKLHQVICDYGKTCNGSKVKGFNLKKWQDYVLSVIDNQLTQQCATLPRSQATEDATPEKACEMFELGRSALEDMCKENELQLLNEALCEYKDKTDKRIIDETKVVIDTKLTSSCKIAISRQADVFNSNVSQSCTIVSQAGPGLIDNQQCTQADIDSLNNTVCYGDSSCDPPYTGICYSGEEPSPRVRRVRTVIGKLTGQCKNVMANSFSQLSQAPPDACQTLEATRKNLIDGNVCTELDFVKLQQVVCMDVPLGTYDGAENEIRDNALFVIENDLTASCHNTLSPQAFWYAGNRDKGCDVIQIAKRCTQEDYDKLDNALCTAG